MARQNAISEYRNVTIEFSNAAGAIDGSEVAQIAAPLDAFHAALELVARIENQYAERPSSFTDLAGASVLQTGRLPFSIHSFTVTTTIASGAYEIIYVETKPNTDA